MNHKYQHPLASLLLALSAFVTGCSGDFEAYEQGEYEHEEVDTLGQAVTVDFSPAPDGFRFGNTFANNFINAGVEITTKGLCGGMVYSALDYYYAGKARPLQNYTPTTGTTLRDHIYARQVNSIESNVDKWAEIFFDPFGWRSSEFFKWGLQKEARVKELRASIDAGKPVPLGLKSIGAFTGAHQVLAIGYTLGAYDAAWLGYPNMKIFVYDPNYPESTRTIVPNLTGQYWVDTQDSTRRWTTYFVDANYVPKAPPNFTSVSKGMVFEFNTAGDDLQGGSHNLDLKLKMKDGSTKTYQNVNASDRWLGSESVAVSLSNPDDVLSVEMLTGFGDRWLSSGWTFRNVLNSVKSTPRISRYFDPPAAYGSNGIGYTNVTLPAVLHHARGGDFAVTHEDSHAVYETWGGTPYCVEIRGNKFHHAPFTTYCDWRNGHTDTIINYLSWDDKNWTATLSGKTFTHKRQGSSTTHQSTLLSYVLNGEDWQLKIK